MKFTDSLLRFISGLFIVVDERIQSYSVVAASPNKAMAGMRGNNDCFVKTGSTCNRNSVALVSRHRTYYDWYMCECLNGLGQWRPRWLQLVKDFNAGCPPPPGVFLLPRHGRQPADLNSRRARHCE